MKKFFSEAIDKLNFCIILDMKGGYMSEFVQIIILIFLILAVFVGIFIIPNIVVNRVKNFFDFLSRIPVDDDDKDDRRK